MLYMSIRVGVYPFTNLWRVLIMLRQVLASLTFGIVTVAVAHSATLAPGGSVSASTIAFPSGTTELFTGDVVSSTGTTPFTANYSIAIISDPANALCANCLDFVYQVMNAPGPAGTPSLASYATGNFNSVATDVFYATGGQVAPTTITRSSDGGTITFMFGTPVPPNEISDFLIVETNVTPFSFAAGFTKITGSDASTATGIGATAVSPEPASFVLLGSGLLGLAGAAKRKFAKA